ncbi:MAG: L,D-transpeptidase family protein [Gammaproteobacteria bacterium]|nr:L,D-transpeptidase family protein [Gammaproteobacteria bacterium]MCP4089059.1 L,D-transpeptidase family protein [Gammaproteobacteria bacterium]MCP4278041.1 L,D-transpeptidase family protein [Gammaproteobacteria bacterium]MCP4833017.1 L,D-transpeptidase family protein [Gammaproteobacteria bacterium]MCP4929258.1 L,D-transpeptidase family protein [Gammaproteobacteria bacterium]
MVVFFRQLLLSIFTGAILAACTVRPAQVSPEPAAALRQEPAANKQLVTYVTGNPPLVTDRFLLTSPDQEIVGALQVIHTRYEDTFVDIARTYNLGFDELIEANPNVDPWLPGEGTRVVLPTQFILPNAPHEGIVINLANKRLFWYLPADKDGVHAVMTFPIGIGLQGTATPTGITTITQKIRNPTWFVPAAIRAEYAAEGTPLPKQVLPGPDNPLGGYALLLGMPSYLIHGTNRPAGVGMRVSHGCVRLFPENIERLYSEVPVGEPVTIVDQPWLVGWRNNRLYLEAHPPLEDDSRDWPGILPGLLAGAMTSAPLKIADHPDLDRVNAIINAGRGIPLPVLFDEPTTQSYLQTALMVNNIIVLPPLVREQVAAEGMDR